ncbi:MAG: hypothetical protein RRY73_04420 [Alistipes sp.]
MDKRMRCIFASKKSPFEFLDSLLIFQSLFHRVGIQNPTISSSRWPRPDDLPVPAIKTRKLAFSASKTRQLRLLGIQARISIFFSRGDS